MSDTAPTVVDLRSPGAADVELSITIDAPADVVFDFLAVPELAMRWMGTQGEVDPRPGGVYRVAYTDTDIAVGEYVDVVRPTLVSWTWGWEGNETVPPGSSLVTCQLEESDGRTTVRLTHSGLPAGEEVDNHTMGWEYWARRLAVAAAGGDPSTVTWTATDEADDEEATSDD